MNYGENNVNAGPLKDFPEICVDRFIGDGLKSSVYFLSHMHTDHMEGLETDAFLKRLKQPQVRLYSHSLTLLLLAHSEFKNKYFGGKSEVEELIRSKKLIPLDADQPIQLNVNKGSGSYNVTVTLLPAGHCPGSVMFLFETNSKRILHTGDCRLTVNALKGMQQLHVGQALNKRVKHIDQLYVDTTFCTSTANVFPERQQAFDDAVKEIREWISKGDVYSVKLQFPARFAHEYVITELHKEFRKKVHVSKERFDIYEHIPGLRDCVSLNSLTPFHFCDRHVDDCLEGKPVKTLKLTSMWYMMAAEKTRSAIKKTPQMIQVCYSMHSSLTEVAEMVDYLKPAIVTPLVRPPKSNMTEIHDSLRKCCSWNFKFVDYQNHWIQPSDSAAVTLLNLKRRSSVQLETNVQREEDKLSDEVPDVSTPKRIKVEEGDSSGDCDWDFSFSPSPKKGSSCCSSKESSQEIKLDECESMNCSQTDDLGVVTTGSGKHKTHDRPINAVRNLGSLLESSPCSTKHYT